MIYKTIKGERIEHNEIEFDENFYFKCNLPDTLEQYQSGNGEGMIVCASAENHDRVFRDKEDGVFIVRIVNDSFYYPLLKRGDYMIAEFRGKNRPCAIYEELQQYIEKDKQYNVVSQWNGNEVTLKEITDSLSDCIRTAMFSARQINELNPEARILVKQYDKNGNFEKVLFG